jgi:hypothetical protein
VGEDGLAQIIQFGFEDVLVGGSEGVADSGVLRFSRQAARLDVMGLAEGAGRCEADAIDLHSTPWPWPLLMILPVGLWAGTGRSERTALAVLARSFLACRHPDRCRPRTSRRPCARLSR